MQQSETKSPAPETAVTGPAVYRAINAVQAALAKEGISKSRTNKDQHYSFRGIDEIYNALAPQLAAAHLCVLPRMKTREMTVRTSKSGGSLFSVIVEADFDFVSADDGSKHTVTAFGEAMDSADKATNKAMSAAYKYACLQTFCIPIEGDNDADASTLEVAGPTPGAPATQRSSAPDASTSDTPPSGDVSEFRSLVAQCHAIKTLTDFERKFVNEQHERVAKYGTDIRVSDKQLSLLRRISSEKGTPGAAGNTAEAIGDDIPDWAK
jgi:hypothetical protein